MYVDVGANLTEKDIRSYDEDIQQSASHRHRLSEKDLKKIRQESLEEIYERDKVASRSLELFFANKVEDCEKLFQLHRDKDPLSAAGSACIMTVKALLSMNQNDANAAMERLSYAIAFAEDIQPPQKGLLKKIGGIFSREEEVECSPGVFRAKVLLALSHALRGFVLLQQATLSTLVKGGIAVRRCYNLFTSLRDEIEQRKKKRGIQTYEDLGVDINSVYAVLMGMGCVNVVLSILPPHAIRILSFLGFTHDRALGVQYLSESFESNTLYSPLTGLFYLTFNTFLAGFNKLLTPTQVPVAKEIVEKATSKPLCEKSMIHHWLLARLCRLEHNTESSISILSDCLKEAEKSQIARSMPQLPDFARYDQAWNYAMVQRWTDAIDTFVELEKKSSWSKIFFTYAQGCCYEMMITSSNPNATEVEAWRKKAASAYWRAAHNGKTILGGQTIPVEDFICARLEEIFRGCDVPYPNAGNKKGIEPSNREPPKLLHNTAPLPILELFIFFDQVHQIQSDLLQLFVEQIDRTLSMDGVEETNPINVELLHLMQIPAEKGDERDSKHRFLKSESPEGYKILILAATKAVFLCYLNAVESRKLTRIIHGFLSKHKMSKSCTALWVSPIMYYIEAYMCAVDGDRKKAVKFLDSAQSASKEPFTRLIDSKVHFVNYALRLAKMSNSGKNSENQSENQLENQSEGKSTKSSGSD